LVKRAYEALMENEDEMELLAVLGNLVLLVTHILVYPDVMDLKANLVSPA